MDGTGGILRGAGRCSRRNRLQDVERAVYALEVWKYERCFGHLPPGFVPPGAQQPAAPPPRVCGQGAPCQAAPCQAAPMGCNECGGGGGMMMDGGMPVGASMPTPAGMTAGKPVVISDELVVP